MEDKVNMNFRITGVSEQSFKYANVENQMEINSEDTDFGIVL